MKMSIFDRLISAPALFAGLAASFLVCCAGGWLASQQNLFRHFQRFHAFITPQTQFYPTASEVRQLVRSRLHGDKVLVVVGGNSILNGSWQAPPDLWTLRLQALLGERYEVVNLGLAGAVACEFGATAAEMLYGEYPKLIYISNVSPGTTIQTDPDGVNFQYFFWDGHFKGFLQAQKARMAWFRNIDYQALAQGEKRRELQTEMALDSALYFNDLWTMVAYQSFFTVWTPRTRDSFWKARKHYLDDDWGPSPGYVRKFPDTGETLRHMVRFFSSHPEGIGKCIDQASQTCFTAAIRQRALLLVMWTNPDYRAYLTAQEQAAHAWLSRETTRHLQRWGFRALEIGQDFLPSDFSDSCHLVASGGNKLAAAVAPEVRKLARRLGYLEEGPGP